MHRLGGCYCSGDGSLTVCTPPDAVVNELEDSLGEEGGGRLSRRDGSTMHGGASIKRCLGFPRRSRSHSAGLRTWRATKDGHSLVSHNNRPAHALRGVPEWLDRFLNRSQALTSECSLVRAMMNGRSTRSSFSSRSEARVSRDMASGAALTGLHEVREGRAYTSRPPGRPPTFAQTGFMRFRGARGGPHLLSRFRSSRGS